MNNWRFLFNGFQIQLSFRIKIEFAVIYVYLYQDTYTDNIRIKELIASKPLRNILRCKTDCKSTKREICKTTGPSLGLFHFDAKFF